MLGNFCDKGIIHQSSCVNNTHQQNEVAGRKNKHLLEVARALSFTTKIPKYIWGEAVLTKTFLINRLPTRILVFKAPLELCKECFPTSQLIANVLWIFFAALFLCIIMTLEKQNLIHEQTKVFWLVILLIKRSLIVLIQFLKNYLCLWMLLPLRVNHTITILIFRGRRNPVKMIC